MSKMLKHERIEQYIDYVFRHILNVKPTTIHASDAVINMSFPEGTVAILSMLNLTNLLVSYGLPISDQKLDLEKDMVHFTIIPAKKTEKFDDQMLRTIMSEWGFTGEIDSFRDSELPLVFRDQFKTNIFVSWACCNNIVDVEAEAEPQFSISGFSNEMSLTITPYVDENPTHNRILQSLWSCVHPIVLSRMTKRTGEGTVVLKVNHQPGRFEVEDHVHNSAITSFYDGHDYKANTLRDAHANVVTTKNIVKLWRETLWEDFYSTVGARS